MAEIPIAALQLTNPVSHRRAEGFYSRAMRRFWKQPGARLSLVVLLLLVVSVLLADGLTPYDLDTQDLRRRLLPPAFLPGGSPDYPLGTDHLGRDLLTRALFGGQVSLLVGFVCSTLSVVLGALLGLIAGTFGGFLDWLIVRLTDVWVAFPFLVLAIAVIAVLGSGLPILITLLTLAGWVYPARVTRVLARRTMQTEYVEAARAVGAGRWRLTLAHVLPNVVSANLVLWAFAVGTLILLEGGLSFLGLGVRPPMPSWGNLLSEGRAYLQEAPLLSLFPGFLLTLTVLCVNTLGDALRDSFDVRD